MINQQLSQQYIASAFISCSLRPEDKPFIDFIERILKAHRIAPVGTVGLFSAAPMNVAQHMRESIPQADFVVIVATPRYLQVDLQSGEVKYGLSEMIHVETGIAYAFGKPVIVFVQEGTEIGKFLPNITEYVVLNGQTTDFRKKSSLITSLIRNTFEFVRAIKQNQSSAELWKLAKGILAVYGTVKLLESFDSNPPKRKYKRRKSYS